jgi:hypothetical protein
VWDETGLVLYAVDPGQYDLSRGELEAERVCRRAKTGGGTAVRLTAHSLLGHAYYPSEFAPLAFGYEYGRDYVGEFAEACRRHGLRFAPAVNVAANAAVAASRPDWRQIGPNGAPHGWGDVPVMCLNTGYLAHITDVVREVVARYGPDCLLLENVVTLDGCRCHGCEVALHDDTGLDLEAALGTEAYREWRYQRTERLAWNLAMAAKGLRGDLAVVFAGAAWRPGRGKAMGWRPERTAEWMDNLETGFAVRWYGHSLEEADLLGAYHRALRKTGWCWVEYAPRPYTVLACPPTELRLKAASVIAAGSRPVVWTLPPMPPADDSGLDTLGEFLAPFGGAPAALEPEASLARTAVLLSRTGDEATGRDTSEQARAWCTALSRERILWDFVLDGQLTRNGLAHYRVLVLPGTPYIPPREWAAVVDFVWAGGSVLLAGEATRYGPHGEALPDFAAAELLGVSYVGEGAASAGDYLRVADLPLTEAPRQPVPAGRCVAIRTDDAQALGSVLPGAADSLALPLGDAEEAPGITWRIHGGGRAAYFAGDAEAVVLGHGGTRFSAAEQLIGELVRWLGGERVRVRGGRDLSVHAHRVPGGAAVHLVARPPSDGRLFESVTPSGEIEIVVSQVLYVSGVRALDGTEVSWELANRRLRIVVRGVEEYRCLMIDGAV